MTPVVARRSFGWFVAAALRRARRWVWSREVMIVFRATSEQSADRLTAFRTVRPGVHWDALEDFRLYTGSEWQLSRARMLGEAAQRLAEGEHCLTVVDQGILAHYHWLQLGRQEITFPEIGATYPLPPGSAVSYRAYTEPALRGRGLHRLSSRECVNTAFALGAKQIFSGVLEANVPSRRAVEGAGYRPVARFICVRRLGLRRVRLEPL